jgi:hypothetical protein
VKTRASLAGALMQRLCEGRDHEGAGTGVANEGRERSRAHSSSSGSVDTELTIEKPFANSP